MGGDFDKKFSDHGISGTVATVDRPEFKACADCLREGDTLQVDAVDRLGRDSIDVQTTVRDLRAKGAIVDVRDLGPIVGDTGELILALLAQVAQIERNRIIARTGDGRERAKESPRGHWEDPQGQSKSRSPGPARNFRGEVVVPKLASGPRGPCQGHLSEKLWPSFLRGPGSLSRFRA